MADFSARGTSITDELGELLGRGGYATVYAGPPANGRATAVKLTHKHDAIARARLDREAEALRAIGPPAVPELFEAGVAPDGRGYLVMERIELPTLAEQLGAEAMLPLDRVRRIAVAITGALGAVHAAGFVHRDLKPHNIFVGTESSDARLIDFGVARAATSNAPALTAVGAIIGTPAYMAPEQIRSERVDHRADVYSFGVVLFQMLAGALPFVGERAQIERGHLLLRPPPPSRYRELPEELQDLVLRCLAKSPAERPQSMSELASGLERAFTGKKSIVTRAPREPAARRKSQRQIVALAFVGGNVEIPAVELIAQRHEGFIASQRAGGLVCVFRGGAHEPLAAARLAARDLLRSGAAAVVIHIDEIRVRRRRSGQLGFSGAAIEQPDGWLPETPTGLVLTDAAAAADRDVLDTELVGRGEVLGEMLAGIERAQRDRRPTFFTLFGDRGVGKSRLASEIAGRVPDAARVSAHEGSAHDGGYHTTTSILRDLLALPAAAPSDLAPGLAAHLGAGSDEHAWKAVAVALGWRTAEAVELSHQQIRRSLIRTTSRALDQAARAQPLVVTIDDAHLADDAALDALAYAGVQAGSRSLWVGLFADPIFATARPHWGSRIEHEQVELPPLSEDDARTLAARLLEPVDNPPAELLQRLAAWTEGNPQRLVDLASALRREGIIRRHPGTESWFIASDQLDRLPRTATDAWLAQRDLERLPPDLGRLLQIVSVIGDRFEVATIDAVLTRLESEQSDEPLVDAGVGLAQLADRDLLARSGASAYQFRQRGRREAIERLVDAETRKALHGYAHRFFSTRAESEGRLESLARHAEASGRIREAVDGFLALAQRATAEYRYLDAEQLYSRVVRILDGAGLPPSARVFRERGQVRRHLTHYEEALADLERAHELARGADNVTETVATLVAKAAVYDFTDRFSESAKAAEAAHHMAPPGLDVLVSARVHNWLGVARHRQQRYEDAVAILRTAVALGSAVADHESVVGSSMMLAASLRNLHRMDEGQQIIDEVIERCRRQGDFFHLTISLCNRINFWRLRGDYQRAIADLERAMELAQEMGYAEMEMYGRAELSTLLLHTGQREQALEQSRIGHEISVRRYRDSPAVVASYVYGQQLAHCGMFDEARAIHEQIASHEVGDNPWLATGIESIAMAVDPHPPARWDAFIERARAALSEPEVVEMLWLRGRAAGFHGHDARARSALQAAAREARTQAPSMVAAIEHDLHLIGSSS